MTRSTFRQAQGGEGTRTAQLRDFGELSSSLSLRAEGSRAVILWFDHSTSSWPREKSRGKLTTPSRVEGRRIEG